jgi:hypothetical protein
VAIITLNEFDMAVPYNFAVEAPASADQVEKVPQI